MATISSTHLSQQNSITSQKASQRNKNCHILKRNRKNQRRGLHLARKLKTIMNKPNKQHLPLSLPNKSQKTLIWTCKPGMSSSLSLERQPYPVICSSDEMQSQTHNKRTHKEDGIQHRYQPWVRSCKTISWHAPQLEVQAIA